jgi:hypothetical protein
MILPRFSLAPVAILAVAAVAQSRPLLVAVLDHTPCARQATSGVRPLFFKSDTGWIALTDPSIAPDVDLAAQSWTVAFDGRSIGSVATVGTYHRPSPSEVYGLENVLPVRPGRRVPRIVNRAHAFGTWCDQRAERPLVLVSQPNYADPQRWRPFQPDSRYRRALLGRFRAAIDTVFHCVGTDSVRTRWQYASKDLIYGKSYADRLGHRLIAIGLSPSANNCDDDPGPEWSLQWFSVGADTLYLGADLELVDAGDYDADGHTEVLFWHSAENEDGYTLFYDQFRKRADVWWHYH